MTKEVIRVRCTNLLCLGPAFRAMYDKRDPGLKTLTTIICPYCGNTGAMKEDSVLSGDEILRQITSWRGKVLYRDAFKSINYKKLPVTMEQQRFREKIKKELRETRRMPIKRDGIDERKRAQ